MEYKSMKEKLCDAYNLAVEIHDKGFGDRLGEEDMDTVYGYVDGITQNGIIAKIEGRCSLQASLDFSMEATEKRIDKDIELFKAILKEGREKDQAAEYIRSTFNFLQGENK